MAKTKVQKQQAVIDLTEKLNRSKSVVFADYKGLTMSQLSELRDKLREQDAQLLVTKNTLMDLALKNANFPTPTNDVSEGPTATLFSFADEITPIKTLVKTFKDTSVGKVKGGFLNAEFLDSFAVTKLSNLPSKQELQGKVVGVLVAPLHGIVGVLQGNLRNLVYVLDQIRIQKGGEIQ